MANINVPEGQAFVAGRSGETASALLKISEELTGSRKGVRAVQGGYIVAAEIADTFMGVDPDAEEVSEVPNEGWKVKEIDHWAAENGIDLAGATNKPDKLKLIAEAQNKE